ncbi:MAG: homocysteine S-methyltransferase family protein [Pseudomonadota bacterium]
MTTTNKKPLILMDGGMGRELERIGAPFKQPEWSALALMEAPETVLKAHENFIHAGAEVIITNSYAVVPFHIGQERFNTKGAELIRLSAELAREAADKATHNVKVAGAIPPLFGSYNPDAYCEEKAVEILAPFIEGQNDFIDCWVIETISCIREGAFVAKELAKTGKPIWAAYTLTDRDNDNDPPSIRSENTIENAVNAALSWENIEAILFNCSQPEEMFEAITITKELVTEDIHIGAYANSFNVRIKKKTDATRSITGLREDLTPEEYFIYSEQWREAGANIIGGCCGIFPDHIQYLREYLS